MVIGLHQSCHTTRLPGHIDSTVVCLVGHLLWLLVCIKAATPLVFPVTSTAPSCVWSGIFCGYWSASKLPHHSSSRSHRQHRRVFGRASFVVIGLHQSCHTTRLPGHIDSTVVCLVGHLLWLLVCNKAATPLVFPVTSTAPSCAWSGISPKFKPSCSTVSTMAEHLPPE